MPNTIAQLREKALELEEQLEAEFSRRREAVRFHFEKRRVVFDAEVRRLHKALRMRILPYLAGADPRKIATAPIIYSLILPLVLLDIFVTIYQWVCFPAYGIKKVPRRDFIAIDRGSLAYLNWIEKLNCIYCGYANGLIGYAREIASRTEQHWCPIKHARRVRGAHPRYAGFADYGDAEAYREGLRDFREELGEDQG